MLNGYTCICVSSNEFPEIKSVGTLPCFSTIFVRGYNFCEFLLHSLDDVAP